MAKKKKSTQGRKKVVFEIQADPGKEIYIAGSFNEWKPTTKQLKEKNKGLYQITMMLPKGRYEYKFIIDGCWCADPDCEEWVSNDHGSLNSVIFVS